MKKLLILTILWMFSATGFAHWYVETSFCIPGNCKEHPDVIDNLIFNPDFVRKQNDKRMRKNDENYIFYNTSNK